MNSTPLRESRVVSAPEPVYTVSFLYTCCCHLGVMFPREVIWDIQHHITDDATYRWQRFWSNVFESILIHGCIFRLVSVAICFFFHSQSPVNLIHVSTG